MKATKETEKIIGKDLLSKMKKGSLFINVARAELVDNESLYELIKSGHIAGAAIDVYENEPPKDYKLAELQNVIATPHIGFYTKKANDNSIKLSVESVLNFLDIDLKNHNL
jgi:phosphoglycerate dehydrogenase-like enzyme